MKKMTAMLLTLIMVITFLPLNTTYAEEKLTLGEKLMEMGVTRDTALSASARNKDESPIRLSIRENPEFIKTFIDAISSFEIIAIDEVKMSIDELFTDDTTEIQFRLIDQRKQSYQTIYLKEDYVILTSIERIGNEYIPVNQQKYILPEHDSFATKIKELKAFNPFPEPEVEDEIPPSQREPDFLQYAVLEGLQPTYTSEFEVKISEEQRSSWLSEYIGNDDTLKVRFGASTAKFTQIKQWLELYKPFSSDEYKQKTANMYEYSGSITGFVHLEIIGTQKTETWLADNRGDNGVISFDSTAILKDNKIFTQGSYYERGSYYEKEYDAPRKRITLNFNIDRERKLHGLTVEISLENGVKANTFTKYGQPQPVNLSTYHSKDSLDIIVRGMDLPNSPDWYLAAGPIPRSATSNILETDGNRDFETAFPNYQPGYTMTFDVTLNSSHDNSWVKSELGDKLNFKWDIGNDSSRQIILEVKGKNGNVFRSYPIWNTYSWREHGVIFEFASCRGVYKDGEKRYDGYTYQGGFILELIYDENAAVKDIVFTAMRPTYPPAYYRQSYIRNDVINNHGPSTYTTLGIAVGDQVNVDMKTFKTSGGIEFLHFIRHSRYWPENLGYYILNDYMEHIRKRPYYGYLRHEDEETADVIDFNIDYTERLIKQ